MVSVEAKTSFQKMQDLFATTKSYKLLRDALSEYHFLHMKLTMKNSTSESCVPYLGLFLSDLTFISDGNQDFWKGTNLINFEKRVMIANVILKIQEYQSRPYCFKPIPEIITFLTEVEILEEKQIFSLSLECEPRVPQ